MVNGNQLGLDVSYGATASNRLRSAIKGAFIDALIYSLFVGIATFFFYARQESLKTHFKELREESDQLIGEARVQMDQLRKEIEELKSQDAKNTSIAFDKTRRIRLILLARLSDYRRELEFWRDTIRKLVNSQGKSKESADTLINHVTESLRTFGTLSSADDYQTISAYAAMLKASDEDATKITSTPSQNHKGLDGNPGASEAAS